MLTPFNRFLAGLFLVLCGWTAAADGVRDLIVTNDLVLKKGAALSVRLIIRASQVTIDGNGATLVGTGVIGDPATLENAGIGVLVENVSNVTIKNLRVHGFALGLVMKQVSASSVEDCDFSDNYTNPKFGWGELPPRGGILLERVNQSVFCHNHACRVWDAFNMTECDDNLVAENDFSHCANTCAKLWKSSRNKFLKNDLSYGLRINPGEVHARDSTCVLIETGSNDNYWYGNNITHGGDGVFIRPLNRWVSTGNVFVQNDMSYANNNCVESWSPGNTFIRNIANHGSYGFWLGGSDHTVLIGNEAAFNGLTNGFHNAPEPGFRHGGIVIVGGPSSHTTIAGNRVHDNAGGGIVFRGDVGSKGAAWQTEHWIIQCNRIESNRFGIWGQFGAGITLAGNMFKGNAQDRCLTNVSELVELSALPSGSMPVARLVGPETALLGQTVRFDASASQDSEGEPLRFHWIGSTNAGGVFETAFETVGLHRVSLTVDNGSRAVMAWRDVLVTEPVASELGTEGGAAQWGFDLGNNTDGKGKIQFADDPSSLIGQHSLRWTPDPYPGELATVIYPAAKNAGWNWTSKKQIRFWIKSQNPNIPGWQNAGPIVTLIGPSGRIEFRPPKDANLLNDPPFSEARWTWMPVVIPLEGNARWLKKTEGTISLERIDAISFGLDSYGWEPFTVWLDGLTVE